jgi:CheY-like chemotaxis protein
MTTYARPNLSEPQPAKAVTERLGRSVLLIGSESRSSTELESQLRAAGCQVETARGSFEYLPRIAAANTRIDILAISWELDDTRDAALIAGLRKLRSSVERPLILSFGSASTGSDVVDARLLKPFSELAFRQIVRSWELASAFRDPPSGPALSRDALADLGRLDGGALLHDLTTVCLESTQEYVGQARRAIEAGDPRALREAAHILKGSSGVFGAIRLGNICDALEELGRTGPLDGASFLLECLQAESKNFDRELRTITEGTASERAAAAANGEGIDLSQMAGTFQGKRIIAQGLPDRVAERLGALLFAMDANFRLLPHQAGAVEWQLAADLMIIAGDQTESSWAECRRLRKQMPRAGMVLLLDDPALIWLDRAEELGAEIVGFPPELRELLLRAYQQLQICRRPRTSYTDPPPPASEPQQPAPPPPPAASGLGSLASAVRGKGRPRALVAEDESLTARFLVSVLEANGFHTDHTDNGTRAVSMLSVRTYDAVLLDLNMPELDGFGVLSRLRQMAQYQNTPVLVLSARNQEKDILPAFSLGASDYVTKPFSPPEVVFRLKRMVERA